MARNLRSTQGQARELRANGWTYDQIAEHFRVQLSVNCRQAYRLAHGLTQEEVAQQWNARWPNPVTPKTGKSIHYWEIWPHPGGRQPSLEVLGRLAFIYQCKASALVDGEDYSELDPARAFGADEGPYPANGEALAARPIADVQRLTAAHVASFEKRTEDLRQLDYREGARKASIGLSGHLYDMNRLVHLADGSESSLRLRLLRAAGDATQLAAWFAIDNQRYDAARRLCQRTVTLAEEGQDASLHAYALGVAGYIHLHAGDGARALGVFENARSVAGRIARPVVRSWLAEAAGEAHALIGQRHRGVAMLVDAERLFDKVKPGNTPPWLTFFNDSCHAARLKGRCLTKLHRPHEAVAALHEALALLPSDFVRERSGTLIDLADAHLQGGKIEQACAAATEADALARRTASERNRKRLRALLVDLMPWISNPAVQDLYRTVLLN